MSSVLRYTLWVRFSKIFLWLLAAGIITIVVWIGSGNNADNGGRMVFTNVPKSEPLQSVMKKPFYQGVDAHNRPYNVSADSGTQQDKDTILLNTINAEMTGDNNAWIALNAGSGVLKMTNKQLELKGGVEIFYDGGYQFRTEFAHVDIANGSASGDAPVEGQGPAGTLQAKSFAILERGNVIRFNGSIKMVLYK
jgi:lipopolysaccharide export system protein LptC